MPQPSGDAGIRNITGWPPTLGRLDTNGNALGEESWKSASQASGLAVIDCVSHSGSGQLPSVAWETISSLNSLRCLRVAATQEHLSRLPLLSNLTSIILVGDDQNRAALDQAGIKAFAEKSRCESLYLWALNIQPGVFKELGRINSLRDLKLDNCTVDASEQEHFKALEKLRRLELPYTKVTATGMQSIGQLTQLQSLNLIACNVGDASVVCLTPLQELSCVFLSHCPITDQGMAKVLTLPHLRIVELQSTQISDESLKQIALAQNVEALSIRNTQITPNGIKALGNLPHLRTLDVSDVQIDSETIQAFEHAGALKQLCLVNCELDDSCLTCIAKIPSLEVLDISSNPQISDVGIKQLLSHPRLISVAIDSCHLSSEAVELMSERFAVIGSISHKISKIAPSGPIVR